MLTIISARSTEQLEVTCRSSLSILSPGCALIVVLKTLSEVELAAVVELVAEGAPVTERANRAAWGKALSEGLELEESQNK